MPPKVEENQSEQDMGDFARFRATFPRDVEQIHKPVRVDRVATEGLVMRKQDDGRTYGHAKKGNGMQIISVNEH